MQTSQTPEPAGIVPPDLLPILGRSRVLTERLFEEVRARVLGGALPSDSKALADRLVAEQILTRFQADRLLRNKAHGLVIDRYVILERLGAGARGRVFKAEHRLMGRLVALKLIAPHLALRASSIARFHREMRLVGRLDHPNVIRAFDADQVGDLLYLVMEYAVGRSLDFHLQDRGPLPEEDVVDYASQAALGLHHAHSRGIIHRDVKPSNLLLDRDGRIKILDLGLGALMDADDRATFATAAGSAVGTVDYMSPEQAIGRELDGRSDLFGLGCTMYHLLTNQLPFLGETLIERLEGRVNGRPVPITEHRTGLSPGLVRVLDRLLARRPEDRYRTGTEAAEALQDLLRRPPAPPAVPPAPEPGAGAMPAPILEPSPTPSGEEVTSIRPGMAGIFGLLTFAAGCLAGYLARLLLSGP